ncbi:MAG: hypothetical protein KDC18_10125 [Alphaproteobacteria bacterium]|nr:hypothetical protein [Alphaproteobacteria bacterium]MCB9930395.1 hypothetical protein [Alphaproteobacteria bacterium]
MRIILATVAALGLGVSTAMAGPLAPGTADDGLELGGMFDNPGLLALGDTIQLHNLFPNLDEPRFLSDGVLASAGAYELGGVALAPLAGFSLTIAVGAANNGVTLALSYDRSRVANFGFHAGADDQTGVLNATITSTMAASVVPMTTGPSTQTVLFMGGELLFGDGLGVYDDDIAGSWNLVSVFTNSDDPVSFSFSLSTADFQTPTATPEPAIVAIIGAGLVGLGLATRRRA